MKPEPIVKALRHVGVKTQRAKASRQKTAPCVVFLSPQGEVLNQELVKTLASYRHLVLLCGHYEGIDERVMSWVDREISIGDYVLTGGELPAMVLIDSVLRMLPGVVKESASVAHDSFYNGLLDHPHYTRPAEFNGVKVPEVLLSGDHAKIEAWRREESLRATLLKRPDLFDSAVLSKEDQELLRRVKQERRKKSKKTV